MIDLNIGQLFFVTGYRIDRRGRVYLIVTKVFPESTGSTEERKGRRFMSRRLAHLWAKRHISTMFVHVYITPVHPVEHITITQTVGALPE